MSIANRENGDDLVAYLFGDGFSFGEINKAGKVQVSMIAKHFEGGRYNWIVKGSGFNAFDSGFHSPAALFIRSQVLEVSQAFSTTANVTSPWIMKTWISYLGNTSICMDSETRCRKTGSFLGRSVCHVVRVDRASRRPASLPKAGCEKYRKTVTRDSPPRFHFPSTIPSPKGIFTCSFRAVPSDTDVYLHVNHSVCFRYCSDCVSLAAAKGGYLSKFCQDAPYYDVKAFRVEYVSEISVGDVIDVQCWEDASNAAILYFLMKTGDKVACRCEGEWYTNQDGSLVVTKIPTIPKSVISNL